MLKYNGEFEKLKDYGFEEYYDNYEIIGYKTPGMGCIYVSLETRELNINTMILEELQHIVYDLIKDGLVDKVE